MPSLVATFSSPTSTPFPTILIASLLLYLTGNAIYNLYLHPLRKYPGPILWRMSQIPLSITWMSGSGHHKILELHQRYGDVVRIAPNHLIYGSPEAWNDMMGHRKRGQDENGKDPDFWRRNDKFTLVGSDRERHSRLRKILSHSFSAQAMVEQQPIFQRYVSLLIEKLKAISAGGPSAKGPAVDINAWYNWTTFDIAGDLIFGEPFGCLEKSQYHPWVKLIFMHIKGIAFSTAVIRFPFADSLVKLITPKSVAKDVQTHDEFTEAQVAKRLGFNNPRQDFMEPMIKAHRKDQVSHVEVIANAHNLIVGSSETTATSLSGTTYLLAKNKSALAKTYEELRRNFDSEDDINIVSVQKLDYMFAVMHESLRIYPPVPSAIPRKAPAQGSVICGQYVPPNTILGIWHWPMFHNPKYFKDPEEFVPERWLGDPRYENDRREAAQPFSVGPRNCIGKNLAYAEMRLILAKMIWNFDIDLDPRSDGWLDTNLLYFLWQKPELFVRLTPRLADAQHIPA